MTDKEHPTHVEHDGIDFGSVKRSGIWHGVRLMSASGKFLALPYPDDLDTPMETAQHLLNLRAEANRFSGLLAEAVAADGLATTVVTCPGWTVRQMTEHVLGIFRWSSRIVAGPIVAEAWRMDMNIDYPTTDDTVAPHFADSVNEMMAVFDAAAPDLRVWVWGTDPHARFWPRRMLHEAIVHGADLAITLGREPEILPALAVDGIDEFLTNLPATACWGAPLDRLRGDGEQLSVRAIDTGDTWRLRFDPTGFWWDRAGDAADATIEGTAADLYLYLQGRKRPGVSASGREDITGRWFEALDF